MSSAVPGKRAWLCGEIESAESQIECLGAVCAPDECGILFSGADGLEDRALRQFQGAAIFLGIASEPVGISGISFCQDGIVFSAECGGRMSRGPIQIDRFRKPRGQFVQEGAHGRPSFSMRSPTASRFWMSSRSREPSGMRAVFTRRFAER